MELLAVVSLLSQRRVLMGLGVLLAISAGFLVGRASSGAGAAASTSSGYTELMLDTKTPQLIKAAPKANASLPSRAFLLANALATDSGKAIVARAADVTNDELTVLAPSASMEPVAGTPLTTRVAAAVASAGTPYVVDVRADRLTPLISINTDAPDAAGARRLADAAVAGVRSLLVAHDGSGAPGFTIDTAVPLRVTTMPSASPRRGPVLMLAATIMTFGLWCMGVVVAVGMARRRVTA